MKKQISQSEFKTKVLEVLRAVESTGEPVEVTHRGVPSWEIRRVSKMRGNAKKLLRGSVLSFEDPHTPTGEAWTSLSSP